MSYKKLLIKNKTSMYVKSNLYDDFVSAIDDVLMLFKLTDHRILMKPIGTRAIEFYIHNNYNDLNLVFKKDSVGKLFSVEVKFKKDKKQKLMDLFVDDKDIVVEENSNKVKVYSFIENGILQILKKIQCV